MLLCKECDYYESVVNTAENEDKSAFAGRQRGICSYCGYVFADDPEDLEGEYPCNQKKSNHSG